MDWFEAKIPGADLEVLVEETDIIGLFTPLYVDTLPYPVIRFLEELADNHAPALAGKRFFVISGCGFPDLSLFEPLFGSCRCFARATGMTWLGGMGYVGAPMLDGKMPEDLGRRGKSIIAGLREALDAVLDGRMVPETAQKAFALVIPRFLFRPLAWYLNRASRKNAARAGTDIHAAPYSGRERSSR